MTDNAIPEAMITALRSAKHVSVLTGAGVSAESGVPTFRDAQTGLWAKYEPTELATPQAFVREPKLVWDWYQWRRSLVNSVAPNPGHVALVAFANQFSRFTLITQNVDGLHQQAGSAGVIELHGSIMRAKCFDNSHIAKTWPDDSVEQPPKCEECGSVMRPDVVWFNESLPPDALEASAKAADDCDVFFSIGTSSLVHPAASLATNALRAGATLVEINPNETPLSPQVHFQIAAPSGVAIPMLVAALKG